MRRPWFATQPIDETFFDRAPMRLSETFAIAKPAPEVWADLTSDDSLSWCRILDRITWTSPRPFSVGTTRTASSLRGTNVIRERYFRWEEGRRKSFYVVEASAPLFTRFAEDYLVEPTSATSCEFTWTIAVEPRGPLARALGPVNRRLLATLLTDTRRHYAANPSTTASASR
jgi:hypothetical protein